MKSFNWIGLAVVGLFLVGCETTTTTKVSASTNDGIEVSRNQYDAEAAAQSRLALGLKYLKRGYMERAKQNLVKAYEHQPDMPDVLYGLGYYYQAVYEYDKADRYYKRALDESPDNPDYLNAYGAFLCDSKNQYADGIEYFLEAISQPNYTAVGETYENAGFCSIGGKQYNQAKEYFEKALTLNPSLVRSLFGLAKVYYEQGNPRRAADLLLRFEGRTEATADSLLLGYKAAKAIGLRGDMRGYGEKLMQLYPNTKEATEYLSIR